jgi:hypothetical protein
MFDDFDSIMGAGWARNSIKKRIQNQTPEKKQKTKFLHYTSLEPPPFDNLMRQAGTEKRRWALMAKEMRNNLRGIKQIQTSYQKTLTGQITLTSHRTNKVKRLETSSKS